MKFSLALLAVSLVTSSVSLAASADISCKAIYRTLDEKNNTVEREQALTPRTIAGDVKHEADFEGKFFSVLQDGKSGDLFAQITAAPDYLKGSVVRGALDSSGRFTSTEVVGPTIHRIECARTRN